MNTSSTLPTIYDRCKLAANGPPEPFFCDSRKSAHSLRNRIGRIKKSHEAIYGIDSLPITTELHERADGSAVLIVKHELFGVRIGSVNDSANSASDPGKPFDYESLMSEIAAEKIIQGGERSEHQLPQVPEV